MQLDQTRIDRSTGLHHSHVLEPVRRRITVRSHVDDVTAAAVHHPVERAVARVHRHHSARQRQRRAVQRIERRDHQTASRRAGPVPARSHHRTLIDPPSCGNSHASVEAESGTDENVGRYKVPPSKDLAEVIQVSTDSPCPRRIPCPAVPPYRSLEMPSAGFASAEYSLAIATIPSARDRWSGSANTAYGWDNAPGE